MSESNDPVLGHLCEWKGTRRQVGAVGVVRWRALAHPSIRCRRSPELILDEGPERQGGGP